MVAQLEHQFRLGRLSVQGLWFYCQVLWVCFWINMFVASLLNFHSMGFYNYLQPMMGSMLALSTVIHKASASNFVGSAVLNLLQSQVKPFELHKHFLFCILIYLVLVIYFVSHVAFTISRQRLWPVIILWGLC